MKYTYQGVVPQLLCTEEGMVTVTQGEVIDLPSAPSAEFVLVETPKPKPKPKAKPAAPVKKKTFIKEEVKETRSK
jgi:hypothetical protein